MNGESKGKGKIRVIPVLNQVPCHGDVSLAYLSTTPGACMGERRYSSTYS
jgi:hypothetical protein